MLDTVRGRAVDLGFAAGWGLLKSTPERVSAHAFRAMADVATVRNAGGTRQLRKNLRRVVGPGMSELRMDRLVGDALRSYSRYWLETFRLPKMDHAAVLARVCTEGAEHLDAALELGRGAVVALPHQGNWDVAGLWVVERYGRFTTVAERLKPESLYERFVAYRESIGMEVLPLTGGERSPSHVLKERLRANRIICLPADRDLSHSGVEVQFFGEATRMPGGPSLLAASTGAALLPVSLWFTEGGWGQRIYPPLELPDAPLREQVTHGTQALAEVFEHGIREHPADWHMLQRLWLADLPTREPASASAH